MGEFVLRFPGILLGFKSAIYVLAVKIIKHYESCGLDHCGLRRFEFSLVAGAIQAPRQTVAIFARCKRFGGVHDFNCDWYLDATRRGLAARFFGYRIVRRLFCCRWVVPVTGWERQWKSRSYDRVACRSDFGRDLLVCRVVPSKEMV